MRHTHDEVIFTPYCCHKPLIPPVSGPDLGQMVKINGVNLGESRADRQKKTLRHSAEGSLVWADLPGGEESRPSMKLAREEVGQFQNRMAAIAWTRKIP